MRLIGHKLTTHTAGPWKAVKLSASRTWKLDAHGWKNFAEVYGNVDRKLNAEGEANARLIAAAPELLESLRDLVGAMHQLDKGHHGDVARAESVIAKAEGR